MRLSPGAYRELHWHQAGEWAYIFNGSARVALVNEAGQSFVDDLNAGDLWFFPPGIPHSIQALDKGVEFLLIFDDVQFSPSATILVEADSIRDFSPRTTPRWSRRCFCVTLAQSLRKTCRRIFQCLTTFLKISCENL